MENTRQVQLRTVRDFLEDLLQYGDTTNEKYYACEKIVGAQAKNIESEHKAIVAQVLTYSNELMWLNLSLERAALSDEKQEQTVSRKKHIIKTLSSIKQEIENDIMNLKK